MAQNIFEDFQEQKRAMTALIEKASEFKWIDTSKRKEMLERLENDILTVGVIGQMKCGKSTFLNAFVFGDDVLPSATTPMTAALSLITYGEKEKITAEFYTPEEWAEQKQTASLPIDDKIPDLERSKRQAAKELVAKSAKLGGRLGDLLGKTQDDELSKLEDYVGADGTYVSITKAVTVYYPKDYLKGVNIVDTPGMNDPIVSREERTREFLSKADVVLMMLYAGRPFDSTDHNILFNDVRKCGPGKVLIGINKYDIPYLDKNKPEDEDEIKAYVKEQIENACKQLKDDTVSEILKDVNPIPLSANMALLSNLPMERINSSPKYQFDWNRYCDGFEISTQPQFLEKSHIDDLAKAVMNLITNEKGQVLLAKPRNEILAAGNSKKEAVEKDLKNCTNSIKILETPDSELDEKMEKLEKAERKFNRTLNKMSDSLKADVLCDKWPKIKQTLEDDVSNSCSMMMKDVDDWRLGESFENMRIKLDSSMNKLSRKISRNFNDGTMRIQQFIRIEVGEFFSDALSICENLLTDFDEKDFIETMQKKIRLQVDGTDYAELTEIFNKEDGFFSSLTNGWIFTRGKNKDDIKGMLSTIGNQFSANSYGVAIEKSIDDIVNKIQKECIDEIISPLKNQIESCKNEKGNKESKLKEAKSKKIQLEQEKNEFVAQQEQIKLIMGE